MQLIICDGKTLEVRTVGPVIFRLTATIVPIKKHGKFLMDEPQARALLRELLDMEIYEGGKVTGG